MATSCEFKTSEASTKSWFRSNKLIDKYLNILDLPGFRKANTKWSNYARQQFGISERLFFEENNGTKATPNSAAFKEIDSKRGVFYQLDNGKDSPLIELEEKLKDKLKQVGVNVQFMDNILDKNGLSINAVAKADLLRGVVEVVEGKRDATTLPEEAAHIFFELLPDGHPLKEAALKRVESTQMYKTVVAQYGEVYAGDELALKKEAVGKLIAQEIVALYKETEEGKSTKNWVKVWFDTIVRYLRNKFKNIISGAELQEMADPFREIASQIMNDKIQELRDMEEVKEEHRSNPMQDYFYELPLNLEEKKKAIRDKLNAASEIELVGEEYIRKTTGEKVRRISEDVQEYNKRIFRKKTAEEEAAMKAQYEPERLKGTFVHKIEQTIMQDLIDNRRYTMSDTLERSKKNLLEEPTFREAYKKYGDELFSIGGPLSFTALENTVKAVYNNIMQNQAKINQIYNTQEKPEIFLEKLIYDPTTKRGGTMDIIVLYSNGTVGRYDYKSIDTTEKRWIPGYKEEAWEVQLDGYTRILANAYGVDKFAESRIVPIGIKFNRKSSNPLSVLSVETANTPEEVAKKRYLSHVPLKEFTATNENINKALQTLYLRKDIVRKKLYESKGKDERARAELMELSDNIKKLALQQDYNFVIDTIDDISEEFHNRETAGGEKMNDRYLSETLDMLNLYKNVIASLKGQFTSMKDFAKDENAKLITAESFIDSLIGKAQSKIKDNLAQYKEGNLNQPGRELTFFGRLFTQLSDINHPAFRKLTSIVREVSNKTREEVNAVFKDIEAKKQALEDLAKSKGLSLQDMYDKLIHNDGKNLRLISKIKKSWYEDRDKAIKNNDYNWFAKHTQISYKDGKLSYNGTIQESFEKFRERKVKEVNENYSGKRNEARRAEEMDKFDRLFNVSMYATAMFNKDNFFVRALEDPANYTEEWKELVKPENKALKDFYDVLIKYNKEFEAMTGGEVKYNFIPRIKQDMIQRLAQNGVASVFDMKENILNAMEVRQNDVIKGSVDPVTGEPIASIPLLYTDNVGANNQSRDLAQNLILFANAAYSYKHLSETEHLVKNIRAIITNPEYKTMLTNATGKPLKDKVTGEILYKSGMPDEDVALFDKYVKQIYYGQMFSNKDVNFELFGKNISVNKAILKLHNFMTLKSLGLNPITSAGNAIGAYSNLLIKATEGKYFTVSDIKDAIKMMSKDNEKYQALIELIQPKATSVARDLANKIAASSIERNLTMEKMLFMMKNPDELLEHLVAVAMMKNYGVKNGKIIKNAGNNLLDAFVKNQQGEYVLDVPKDELYRFRQMVIKVGTQIKGSIPQDDKMAISNSVYGYSLMFFKNWIIPLGRDEFGKLRFDPTMQEFEAGRMYIAGQQIFQKGGLKELAKILQEFAFMGGLKKINKDFIARKLDQYIDDNPEMADMISRGEITREQLLDQYQELTVSKLKGAINRVRMMLGWFIITQLLKAAIPDDDEKDWQAYLAQNSYMMANRGWLETSFFLSPSSANQIVSKPFMLWGLVTDLQKWGGNTFDESRDILFGEDSNQDKSPLTYYTVTRFTPFGKPISQVFDFYDNFSTK